MLSAMTNVAVIMIALLRAKTYAAGSAGYSLLVPPMGLDAFGIRAAIDCRQISSRQPVPQGRILLGCLPPMSTSVFLELAGSFVHSVACSAPTACFTESTEAVVFELQPVANARQCHCARHVREIWARTPLVSTCTDEGSLPASIRVWASVDWLNTSYVFKAPLAPQARLRVFACANDASSDVFRKCHWAQYIPQGYIFQTLNCTGTPPERIWAASRWSALTGPVLLITVVNAAALNKIFVQSPLANVTLLVQQDEYARFGLSTRYTVAAALSSFSAAVHCPVHKNYFDRGQFQLLPRVRFFPLGPRAVHCDPIASCAPLQSVLQRRLLVSFVASPTHPTRRHVASQHDTLGRRFGDNRVRIHVSDSWEKTPGTRGTGLKPVVYQQILATSMFTLIVIGHNVEQFRFYEACAVGTIPIFVLNETHDALAPRILESPAVFLDSWDSLENSLATLLANPTALVRRQRDLVIWYTQFMVDAAFDLLQPCPTITA